MATFNTNNFAARGCNALLVVEEPGEPEEVSEIYGSCHAYICDNCDKTHLIFSAKHIDGLTFQFNVVMEPEQAEALARVLNAPEPL